MTSPGLDLGLDDSGSIRVFLVDDQELVRTGFAMILDATPGMTVCGHAENGVAALSTLQNLDPPAQVVLMDIRMPRLDGIETTRQLTARPDPPRVIVLTTFELDELVVEALRAGASGFLLKDAGPADLLSAIRAAHAGESVIAPRLTRRPIDAFVIAPAAAPPRKPDPRLEGLTERETEVLLAVGRGGSNTEIAAELFIAEATVKTHLGSILRKLELRDRIQAVVLVHESGLAERSR